MYSTVGVSIRNFFILQISSFVNSDTCMSKCNTFVFTSNTTLLLTTTMLTDNQGEVQFVSKRRLQSLFLMTERYHRKRLRDMFLEHYQPCLNDGFWTNTLPESVMNHLRLHLSWELGVNTFQWGQSRSCQSHFEKISGVGHVIVHEEHCYSKEEHLLS